MSAEGLRGACAFKRQPVIKRNDAIFDKSAHLQILPSKHKYRTKMRKKRIPPMIMSDIIIKIFEDHVIHLVQR